MIERALNNYINSFKNLVAIPSDSEDTRTKKSLFALITYLTIICSLIGGSAYYAQGNHQAGGVLFSFIILSLSNLIFFYGTKRFYSFSLIQLALMLLFPFVLFLQISETGYAISVLIWALLSPMSALILYGYKHALVWFIDYITLLIVLVIFGGGKTDYKFFIIQMNIVVVSIFIFLLFQYFVQRTEKISASLDLRHKILTEEQEKSTILLNNLLPEVISERLKLESGMIADSFEEVTVLFADIVGFTQLSSQISPKELVDILNILFSAFDMIAEKHGLEKIKTMGDSYMVAAGLPVPTLDHAVAATEMARDMLEEVRKFSSMIGEKINVRIGLNSGPVVAGVIGIKKSIYDLWGDTVNVASRMESTGVPGKIQVTEATYNLIKHKYHFISRGEIQVKGKGFMNAFILEGPKE